MVKRTARRVLIIVENLPVPFDRRVWQEACALRDAGFFVTVICPTGRGYEVRDEVLEGVRVLRHSLPMEGNGVLGFIAEYVWALAAELRLAWHVYRESGVDIVHACNPPDNIFLVALLFKLVCGARFVFDHHDLSPELYLAKGGRRRSVGYALTRLLERLTFRLADVSIATNESYKRIAIDRGGMNPEHVFVVRSGPDLSRVRPVPPDPTLRNGRRYLVGYVGVMGKQEGIHHLLEAVRLIVHDLRREDVQFALVGSGPEHAAMVELAGRLGISNYVTFTGRVPDDEMLAVLSTADVCVNPDTYNEMNDKSTMNKVMEYMALGKPIVQFDLTEGRVSAGAASSYAEPNSPSDLARELLLLLSNDGARVSMGLFGRSRIDESLAWVHQRGELLRAYAAVVGEAQPSGVPLWFKRPA